MAHLFVKDIKPGQQINEIYMVTQPVLRNTTRGDLYIAMYLSDRTDRLFPGHHDVALHRAQAGQPNGRNPRLFRDAGRA